MRTSKLKNYVQTYTTNKSQTFRHQCYHCSNKKAIRQIITTRVSYFPVKNGQFPWLKNFCLFDEQSHHIICENSKINPSFFKGSFNLYWYRKFNPFLLIRSYKALSFLQKSHLNSSEWKIIGEKIITQYLSKFIFTT